MKIFGIFGDPIEHSLSPAMQNAALRALGEKACYHAFRVAGGDLLDALLGARAMGFAGLNLTIPLKEKALELDLSKEDPQTKRILKLVQALEHKGYHFEAAEASFELLMKKALKKYKKFFTLSP